MPLFKLSSFIVLLLVLESIILIILNRITIFFIIIYKNISNWNGKFGQKISIKPKEVKMGEFKNEKRNKWASKK